ncbi:MAG: hypothetical protein A2202_08955 [Bdellovibrionales bacterium RIFOXYA1_FULL_36_14]|nr:MAG: hypothetical protein A2202_08955 [Bdellovibrionales bacterium RIFOXYA1_FULL_36_14]
MIEFDEDLDFSFDWDDEYEVTDSSKARLQKDGKKKRPNKKKVSDIAAPPKMSQISGKVIPTEPGNLSAGISLKTDAKVYEIEMDDVGKKLTKELYHEVLVCGYEKKEGNRLILSVKNYI